MKIDRGGKRPRIRINPGEFFASGQDVIISTLLGSCVSACLYDPFTKVVGMNHFLLSNKRYARNIPTCESEAGRYGIHAMELLINEMLKLGAKRNNLQAKAFGGGNVLQTETETETETKKDNFFCVGDMNCRFIREFLRNDGIYIISEDLGGEEGRVIHFSAADYSVYVRKIKSLSRSGLAQRDRGYWKKTLQAQAKTEAETEPEIWL